MKGQREQKAAKATKEEPSGAQNRMNQWQKEARDQAAEFQKGYQERKADLTKKMDVIVDLDRKMVELMQQLREMGAFEASRDVVKTNLTVAERQTVEPICLLYSKYEKLKRSLALEHDRRNCVLNVDIMAFNWKVTKAEETIILREVGIFENALKEGCDAAHRYHYEEQLLQLKQQLAKAQQLVVEHANQHAHHEQQLRQLGVMEERSARAIPALRMPAPPPPPRSRGTHMSAKVGTAASPEEKNVKSNDTRRRSEPTPPSTEEQPAEDIDEDVTDAAAASSSTAASRKKKNNKKKSAKGDAQPPASTDEPSEETTAADIVPSDQPSEANEVTSTSDSNEATAPLQLRDEETTTAVVPAAAALGEDGGVVPTVVAATALSTVDVANAEDVAVDEKNEGKNAIKSPKSVPSSPATATTATEAVAEGGVVPDTSAVVAAQSPASPARAPSKPASTSTNSPKSTSALTPTTSTPTTPKPFPVPAASSSATPPQTHALVPLDKVTIKSTDGLPTISVRDFCDACRDLEQSKTRGREIVSYYPRGFVNTGNACYRNSVLQSLLASPPLIRLLSSLSDNVGRMPESMSVWREVLTLTGELANEPLPQLYTKKSSSVASSASSGQQAGKAPDQRASVKPQGLAAVARGPSSSSVGNGKSQSGASSGGGTGAITVLGGDTLTPDAYFVKTFVDFRKKMALLRGEAPSPDVPFDNVSVVDAGSGGSSSVVRPRIPQEDAMEFMTYLLESLNDEITGMDTVSEEAAAKKEADNAGWESVSTTKTKIKVKNVVDDKSRMTSAKGNAATTVTRLFYGTLRSVVCYPANKSSANKKINSATFQPFSNLNLNITEPMELTGPYSLQNFKRESATPLVPSAPLSTLSNEPVQQCLLPPLTLGCALEGYFQSTPLDEGAYKTIQFEHLPQVLVLQLDRFYYDYNRNVPNKIDRDIRYPMTLDLPKKMLSAELIDRLQEEASKEPGHNNTINMSGAVGVSYSLVAVVRHHGATATSGHYTALCRDNKRTASSATVGSSISGSLASSISHATEAATSATGSTGTGTTAAGGGKWGWEYDDAKVTSITADDALQATQTAYILLYCRN